MKVLVVIPTYNEIESLPGALDRVRAAVPEANILVVDDSSPDGTGALADSCAGEDEHSLRLVLLLLAPILQRKE